MIVTEKHIETIRKDLCSMGVTSEDLLDDLTDHICCQIEANDTRIFYNAYQQAMSEFGSFGPEAIQQNIYLLTHLKRMMIMKTTRFILCYLAVILSTTGLLFRVMHWPGANVMLVLGIGILNFGYLPMFFYHRLKHAKA